MFGGAITTLTEIQDKCLEPGISGRDIIAKASTGSGKSLAFLMVGVERILKHGGPDPRDSFPIVILSPVTDLATQIADVARALLAHHPPMTVDLVIGGTSEQRDIRRLSSDERVDILVATPGRFKSILKQSSAVRHRLSRCQTFVIDEADKLTDPGFLHDTRFIWEVASNPGMQTLAFSATLDRSAMLRTGLLADNAEFVDATAKTVSNNKPQNVRRTAIVTPVANLIDAVVHVVQEQMEERGQQQDGGSLGNGMLSDGTLSALQGWATPSMTGYRVMVFLSSNAFIDYFSRAFERAMPRVRLFTLHGNMPQHRRSQISNAFRTTDNCVLFTSDASARGVDYPDVSCVVQVGYDSRSEYLQRVGRTGRAGKSGTAFLIIAPAEVDAASEVCDMLQHALIDESLSLSVCDGIAQGTYQPTGAGMAATGNHDRHAAKQALRGWLGSLASRWKRLRMAPRHAMDLAQDMSEALGLGAIDEGRLREKLHIRHQGT